jgi:hypothetical protein
MLKKIVLGCACVLAALPLRARSFGDIFPGIGPALTARVFSADGFIDSYEASEGLTLRPAADSGVQITGPVLAKGPSFFVESLQVIPDTEGTIDLVKVYNVLGKVRNLKDRRYHSASRGEVPLFEEAARIESIRKTSPLPDPPDAASVPASQTIYIRLKDATFGNSYYEADLTADRRSLRYRLINKKNLSYGIIPVIKEEKFITQIYIEPLTEGLMIYSVSGADVSNFIASRINVTSAIRKRVETIIDWLADGVKGRG